MTALTQDRVTTEIIGTQKIGSVAAAQVIFMGAILMRNAAGNIVKGSTALNLRGVGRASASVNNPGAAGAARVPYEEGIYRFWPSGTAFTEADIGKVVFAVDDQTVAKDNGANTRSPAGFLHSIDGDGVFVEFDESKLVTWIAASA